MAKPKEKRLVLVEMTRGEIEGFAANRYMAKTLWKAIIVAVVGLVVVTLSGKVNDALFWICAGLFFGAYCWYWWRMWRVGRALWLQVKDKEQPVKL